MQHDAFNKLLYTTGAFTIYNRKPYYMCSEALLYTTGGSIIYNRRLYYIQQEASLYNKKVLSYIIRGSITYYRSFIRCNRRP